MEVLDLALTSLYEGSVGIAYEEFSGEDYYRRRNCNRPTPACCG